MKMWDQEELLRCWVGQRKHKSDFGETNQFFLKLKKPKHIYPAMAIYFRKKPISIFDQIRILQIKANPN